jgi:uncharacterized protein (TIGR02147 family)
MNIFNYFDYRLFLKDFYEEKKKENSFFSYRYMGSKIGIDAGYLVKVLQGKYHIAESSIKKIAEFLKLNDKETEYFATMVNFAKAKSERQTKIYFEKLLSLKNIKSVPLEEYQYEFYKKWYYTAIRSLIGWYDFDGDYKKLGQKLSPPISAKEAKEAVKLLEKLDLIRKSSNGKYELTNNVITTGKEWKSIAVKEFQLQTIELAKESLERHPKDIRDISTVTVSVCFNDIPEIKERIAELRNSILSLASESQNPDCVYQLNIQLVPLTNIQRNKP